MLSYRPTINVNSNIPSKALQIASTRMSIETGSKKSPSPNHRSIKIKLVSPLKNKMSTPQTQSNCTSGETSRNLSPATIPVNKLSPSKSPSKHLFVYSHQHQPNILIRKHHQYKQTCQQPDIVPSKYKQFILMKENTSSDTKPSSPVKVSINNKSFDLGSIKSQIIYVAPFGHVNPNRPIKDSTHSNSNQTSILWRRELIIQEQNQPQSSKQNTHRSQLKQLKEQLEQSTMKIKQTLNKTNKANQSLCISEFVYSSVKPNPKCQQSPSIYLQDIPLEYSRLQTQNKIVNPIITQKTLINDLALKSNPRLSTNTEEMSIQTQSQTLKILNKPSISYSIQKAFEYSIFASLSNYGKEEDAGLCTSQIDKSENSQLLSVQCQAKEITSETNRIVLDNYFQEPNPTSIQFVPNIAKDHIQPHQFGMQGSFIFNKQIQQNLIDIQNGVLEEYKEECEQNLPCLNLNTRINNSAYL